jgi:hypothetical protein
LHAPLFFPMRAICPTNLIFLITCPWAQIIKLLVISFWQVPPYFFPLWHKYLLSTLFSKTSSLRSFLSVRDQVSHPDTTTVSTVTRLRFVWPVNRSSTPHSVQTGSACS